jgi:hypothetical protein
MPHPTNSPLFCARGSSDVPTRAAVLTSCDVRNLILGENLGMSYWTGETYNPTRLSSGGLFNQVGNRSGPRPEAVGLEKCLLGNICGLVNLLSIRKLLFIKEIILFKSMPFLRVK